MEVLDLPLVKNFHGKVKRTKAFLRSIVGESFNSFEDANVLASCLESLLDLLVSALYIELEA